MPYKVIFQWMEGNLLSLRLSLRKRQCRIQALLSGIIEHFEKDYGTVIASLLFIKYLLIKFFPILLRGGS